MEKGVASLYLSQLVPARDPQTVELPTESDKLVYQNTEHLSDDCDMNNYLHARKGRLHLLLVS